MIKVLFSKVMMFKNLVNSSVSD